MTGFMIGLGEVLAVVIVVALMQAWVVRMNRPELGAAIWYGLGAAGMMSFAIGAGLASAGPAVSHSYIGLQLGLALPAAAAAVGLFFAVRNKTAAPAEWLATTVVILAATPHGVALMGRLAAAPGGTVITLATAAGGSLLAVALGFVLHRGLLRLRLPQLALPAPRRLAPVKQKAARR